MEIHYYYNNKVIAYSKVANFIPRIGEYVHIEGVCYKVNQVIYFNKEKVITIRFDIN